MKLEGTKEVEAPREVVWSVIKRPVEDDEDDAQGRGLRDRRRHISAPSARSTFPTSWLMIGCRTRWPIDPTRAGDLDVRLPGHRRRLAPAALRERPELCPVAVGESGRHEHDPLSGVTLLSEPIGFPIVERSERARPETRVRSATWP
jgi:hypothetical protein